jgi:hypothetical protein
MGRLLWSTPFCGYPCPYRHIDIRKVRQVRIRRNQEWHLHSNPLSRSGCSSFLYFFIASTWCNHTSFLCFRPWQTQRSSSLDKVTLHGLPTASKLSWVCHWLGPHASVTHQMAFSNLDIWIIWPNITYKYSCQYYNEELILDWRCATNTKAGRSLT